MPQPTPIEAGEYSRWDDDDLDDPAGAAGVPRGVAEAVAIDTSLTFVAGDEADGGRLDKWLAARLPDHSRSRIQRWIAGGHVRFGSRVATTRDPVWKDDAVTVEPQPGDEELAFRPEAIPLDLVHEDASVLVVDKPAGLVVHPGSGHWTGTLLNGLLHHAPALAQVPRAGIVHRLDKDTSGLMVVAKTVVAQTDLVRQLQARSVGRTYVALVHGTTPATGRIAWPMGRDPRDRLKMAAFRPTAGAPEAPLASKPAATRFETLSSIEVASGKTVSVVLCRLETGRTHQIRVHLQALGHPLVGDAVYGGLLRIVAFDRQALHAWRLRFVHPDSKASVAWRATPPGDLMDLAASLGFDLAALLDAASIDGDDG